MFLWVYDTHFELFRENFNNLQFGKDTIITLQTSEILIYCAFFADFRWAK